MLKVEKVVNAPKKPIETNCWILGEMVGVINDKVIPNPNEPIMFTISMASGKGGFDIRFMSSIPR